MPFFCEFRRSKEVINTTAFRSLETDVQARLIFDNGVFISKILYFQLSISLFRIDDEFVEIWYNTLTGTIRKIEPLQQKKISPFIKHLAMVSVN